MFAALLVAASSAASDLQFNGFALLRPQTPSTGTPLDDDAISAQVQLGVDWRPAPAFGAHVHVLARNEEDKSRRGRVGIVEAYVEANKNFGRDRLRILAGAFFLPTSRENIDSLWESPYTISSSALNTWMGEEFRPIGVDVSYRRPLSIGGAFTGGATVYRGNDTFGALPLDRGWDLNDRWALLGEHLWTERFFTSVSAELDGRLGWSARGKWNNDRVAVQYTRIDNRSDALRYGDLFNWATRYNIIGADTTLGEWTFIGEMGWGTTAIQGRRRRSSAIQSNYVLVSRRLPRNMRASVRYDDYRAGRDLGEALTLAFFWEPVPKLRAGIEAITAQDEERLALELRYRF